MKEREEEGEGRGRRREGEEREGAFGYIKELTEINLSLCFVANVEINVEYFSKSLSVDLHEMN